MILIVLGAIGDFEALGYVPLYATTAMAPLCSTFVLEAYTLTYLFGA